MSAILTLLMLVSAAPDGGTGEAAWPKRESHETAWPAGKVAHGKGGWVCTTYDTLIVESKLDTEPGPENSEIRVYQAPAPGKCGARNGKPLYEGSAGEVRLLDTNHLVLDSGTSVIRGVEVIRLSDGKRVFNGACNGYEKTATGLVCVDQGPAHACADGNGYSPVVEIRFDASTDKTEKVPVRECAYWE